MGRFFEIGRNKNTESMLWKKAVFIRMLPPGNIDVNIKERSLYRIKSAQDRNYFMADKLNHFPFQLGFRFWANAMGPSLISSL